MGASRQTVVMKRDKSESLQRIRYKYAKPYMDVEPATSEALNYEIERILRDELSEEEKENLGKDIDLEMKMIEHYYRNTAVPNA